MHTKAAQLRPKPPRSRAACVWLPPPVPRDRLPHRLSCARTYARTHLRTHTRTRRAHALMITRARAHTHRDTHIQAGELQPESAGAFINLGVSLKARERGGQGKGDGGRG